MCVCMCVCVTLRASLFHVSFETRRTDRQTDRRRTISRRYILTVSLLLDVVVGLQRQDDDTLGERPGPGHRRPPAAEIHVTRLESRLTSLARQQSTRLMMCGGGGDWRRYRIDHASTRRLIATERADAPRTPQ